MIAILAAHILILHTLLLTVLGATQAARAGDLASAAVICLTHDASAPAPSDNPDHHAACLDHCVLCAGIHAALPTHGVSVRTAQRVGAVLRWRAAHIIAPKPHEISSASPRGPPLAA